MFELRTSGAVVCYYYYIFLQIFYHTYCLLVEEDKKKTQTSHSPILIYTLVINSNFDMTSNKVENVRDNSIVELVLGVTVPNPSRFITFIYFTYDGW